MTLLITHYLLVTLSCVQTYLISTCSLGRWDQSLGDWCIGLVWSSPGIFIQDYCLSSYSRILFLLWNFISLFHSRYMYECLLGKQKGTLRYKSTWWRLPPKNIYIRLNFAQFIKSAFNEKRESLELPWTLTFPGGASINNQKDLIERDKGFQKVWDGRVKSLDGQGKGPNGYVSTWRQVGGNSLYWIVDFSLFNLGTHIWAHILLVLIFMLETLTRQ